MGQLMTFPTRRPAPRKQVGAGRAESRGQVGAGRPESRGQVIAARPQALPARLRMAREVLCGLAYALGYFLVTPVLALVVLAGVFDGELAVSAGALALLAGVIPLATAARRSIP